MATPAHAQTFQPLAWGMWFLFVLACAGTPPQAPAPSASALPTTSAAEPAEPGVDAYVAALRTRLAQLERVDAPDFSEGDLTRSTSGWRDEAGSWVWLEDTWSVGEYGHRVHTLVLRDGAAVYRSTVGHEHAPSSDDPSRFVYFEEEHLPGPGATAEQARRRELVRQQSGLDVDLETATWEALPTLSTTPTAAEMSSRLELETP